MVAMTGTPVLEFLNNEADEEEGLGHAGIETFKSSPFAGVARECGQNSADARSGADTVRITFDLIEVPTEEFPEIGAYRKIVQACQKKSELTGGEKELDFFSQAAKTINAGTLKILRISDFNTKGLIGPAKPGTPFHSLVKSYGVNVKDSDASLGSFGIGKNAVFALSDLQTVFYSTLYKCEETGDLKFLAQGKSILISHTLEGRAKKATGYWGLPLGFQPIESQTSVPEWMRRNEVGTSLFAIGLREEEHWGYRIAASIIENFFCAIHRQEMEFSINDGEIIVNRETLAELFDDPRIQAGVDEAGDAEDFAFSKNLYMCLVSDAAEEEISHIPGFGDVSIRILLGENLPKRVGLIRNGMFITDSMEKFGEKFRRFAMYREFVALVEPKGEEESAFIKKLENPRHDGISADRISDSVKRHEAIRLIKNVAKAIRDAIKGKAQPEAGSETTLDELGEFFGDVDKHDRIPDPNAEDTPETYTYNPVIVPPKKPISVTPKKPPVAGSDGGAGFAPQDTRESTGGDNTGEGDDNGTGAGGEGNLGYKVPLSVTEFRNLTPLGGNAKTRRLIFTPNVTGVATIRIKATCISGGIEPLAVNKTGVGTVSSGGVVLELRAGERTQVDVELLENFSGPIELTGDVEVANEG